MFLAETTYCNSDHLVRLLLEDELLVTWCACCGCRLFRSACRGWLFSNQLASELPDSHFIACPGVKLGAQPGIILLSLSIGTCSMFIAGRATIVLPHINAVCGWFLAKMFISLSTASHSTYRRSLYRYLSWTARPQWSRLSFEDSVKHATASIMMRSRSRP